MASPYIDRLPRALLLLLRVILPPLAILYGARLIYAEIEYAAAWQASPEDGYSHIEAATAAFPFDQRFRLGTAYYLARRRWEGSRPTAEAEISMALMTDPYAMELRKDLAGLLFEDGDKEQMQQQMRIIHYFQPKAALAIQVNINPANR